MAEAPLPGSDGGASFDGWNGVRELHPVVLASRLAAGDDLRLIDVREEWEWELVRLEGAAHHPLAGFVHAASQLDRSQEIVVYCHHGLRSLMAANYLSGLGFRRLWNLSGGIERYAAEADPTLPRY